MDEAVCVHRRLDRNKDYSFCAKCGVLIFDNVRAMKPVSYEYKIEVHPLKIYHNMQNTVLIKNPLLNQNYMAKRQGIIKKLQIMTNKLKFRRQTFFVTLYFLDHIFREEFDTFDLDAELIALNLLIIAAKYEENDPIIPYMSELQTLYPKLHFLAEDIKRCEIFCLKSLNYNLTCYTAYHFINYFALNGLVFSDEVIISNPAQKLMESDKKASARDYSTNTQLITYSGNSNNVSVSHRETMSQKHLDKIYTMVKDILVYVIEGKNICDFTEIQIACSCIAVGRTLNNLRLKWPFCFERLYGIKFEDFKDCFNQVKTVYSQKLAKKQESSLFQQKENVLSRVETTKFIETKIQGLNSSNKEEKNTKHTELSQNRSAEENHNNAHSKERATYVKKVIKEKNKYDYSDTKLNSKAHQEDRNDILYRVKRPLNINTSNGTGRTDQYITQNNKEKSRSKSKNLRELKKSLINNYSQIHKKANVSELVSRPPQGSNNYNNSFLFFNNNIKGEYSKRNQNNSKSREASTSVNKQNSFDCNLNGKILDTSAKKKTAKFALLNNSSTKEESKANKSSYIEKVETTQSTNTANVTAVPTRRGSINLGGISILKRLSNKKSLNLDLKNMYKVDLNYKKMSGMNISISGLND